MLVIKEKRKKRMNKIEYIMVLGAAVFVCIYSFVLLAPIILE